MVYLDSYTNALKITWIRRLISTNSKYKTLFETMHTNINDLINRGSTYINEIQSRCTNKFCPLRLLSVLRRWFCCC